MEPNRLAWFRVFPADPLTTRYWSRPKIPARTGGNEVRHGHQGTKCPIEISHTPAGRCDG
jgi:hypothetical protein